MGPQRPQGSYQQRPNTGSGPRPGGAYQPRPGGSTYQPRPGGAYQPKPGGSTYQARPGGTYQPKPGGYPQKTQGTYQGNSQSTQNKTRQDRPQMTFLNDQIKAPNIMILDDEGNNVGTFSRYKAMEMAQEKGMDLVQIKYEKEKLLSIAKIVDYGKYIYNKQRTDKENKKNRKEREMKELKFGFAIGENDLNLKVKKAEELLKDGHNVRFVVRLKGRENIYAEKVKEKLANIVITLANFAKPQHSEPKREAQGYSIVLFPKSK